MTRALRAWAISEWGKNSVRNLQYGPRTRLVRGIYHERLKADSAGTLQRYLGIIEVRKDCFLLNRSLFAALL